MEHLTFEHCSYREFGSYRYMLEAFVDKVRGRTPQTWVSEEDTLANMRCIEMVYENVSDLIGPCGTTNRFRTCIPAVYFI